MQRKFHYIKSIIQELEVLCGLFLFSFLVTVATSSCKKLVAAEAPKTSLTEANVFGTDVAAISVLTGLYYQINSNSLFDGRNSISLMAGLSADEYTLFSGVSKTDTKYYHYIDSLFSNITGSKGTDYWTQFYNYIYKCNAAIDGLTSSSTLTPAVKLQLLGEAKFLRAFLYFYLLNLYGDIPLAISTDWQTNSNLTRVNKNEAYEQIMSDLKEAQVFLSEKFLDGNLVPYVDFPERVRPTKWAAMALLARVYLFTGDWSNAESQATAIIDNTSLFSLSALNSTFLKNSTEAIWQLQPIVSGQNTSDALLFIIPSSGPSNNYPIYLSNQLLNSFEFGDQRRYNQNWVDSVIVGSTKYYFPYKYKERYNSNIVSVNDLTEYSMVLRLGEQFIIRAEARAQMNNIDGAKTDLNSIRGRAGLSNTPANDKASLLNAIVHERQVELFSEWGHRWLDLKRSGSIDAVMSIVRPLKASGTSWKPYMQLYPILYSDIEKNANLIQNTGY